MGVGVSVLLVHWFDLINRRDSHGLSLPLATVPFLPLDQKTITEGGREDQFFIFHRFSPVCLIRVSVALILKQGMGDAEI